MCRYLFAFILGGALLALGSCHGHSDEGPRADEYFYDCEAAPAGLATFATDESFALFVNKEAAGALVTNDGLAPVLTVPVVGTTLTAGTPPKFSFDPRREQATAPSRGGGGRFVRACRRPSRWDRIAGFFTFEGVAHAHCGAVTGENYLFRVTDGTAQVYTAVLSVTSFTPHATVWQKALGGRVGRTLTITIARAVLVKGKIDEGPYVPTMPPTFVVGS